MTWCETGKAGLGGAKRRIENISIGENGDKPSASATQASGMQTRSGSRRSNATTTTQQPGNGGGHESSASATQARSVGPRRSSRRSKSTTTQAEGGHESSAPATQARSSAGGNAGTNGSNPRAWQAVAASRVASVMQARSGGDSSAPSARTRRTNGRGSASDPVELRRADFDDKPEALVALLKNNDHFKDRPALQLEKNVASGVAFHLRARNIQAYRSSGTGSATDPSTNRFGVNIVSHVTEPAGYTRDLTPTGRAFMRGLAANTDAFNWYGLGWNHTQQNIPNLLIGWHADQSSLDYDRAGNPFKFIVREVTSLGMAYTLDFAMVAVWYVEVDGEPKLRQKKITGCSFEMPGVFHAYCMDPVGGGHHVGYKMEVDGVMRDIIFRHQTRRIDGSEVGAHDDSGVKARGIFNRDFAWSSDAEAAQGIANFMTGTQDPRLSSYLSYLTTFPSPQFNQTLADVASAFAALRVYEHGDCVYCLACPNKATCCDTRLALDPPAGDNSNGVTLERGVCVISYWIGEEEASLSFWSGNGVAWKEIPGVISNVAREGVAIIVSVTFLEADGTRSHWKTNDPDRLFPAPNNRELGSRDSILRQVFCDECVCVDEDLMRTRHANLIEDPCRRCFENETLPRCKGCASCCGNPTCRGVKTGEGGAREFHCEGVGANAEEGAPLTLANISSGRGYICQDCENARQRAAYAAKSEESGKAARKEMTAEAWRALFAAIEDKSGSYVYPKGAHKGKANYAAMLGSVDGVPGIPLLTERFGKDAVKLRGTFNDNWTRKTIAKTIDFSNNCSQCTASEGGCEFVGKKITSLALFDEYTRHHKSGGQFGTGVKGGGMKGSRFDDWNGCVEAAVAGDEQEKETEVDELEGVEEGDELEESD